ncbi:ATP-grasp domain-containing protein [Lysinibacillus sp. SGAir0095]|uniref:ATP-grasp domain-containing protein n=1 Tax=Lysinibacillus sp. SGAir0095 TaxID=2070463 RepID=UPI00197B29D2|nr:ATP-grasp domain-containing protein [Lysinibacillus sp. SGAir0095]
MKKLLMLGGSQLQVPAIKKAKELGHYVILCDISSNVPGELYAHEFYSISTSDKLDVLKLAEALKVDGIVCYGADSGAQTAAYVAEMLDLPTNPYKAVELLTNKDRFREFQRENGFNVPKAKGFYSFEEAKKDFHQFKLPVMIKPVDSSGSRGISMIDSIDLLEEKVEHALNFSKVKRFIMEEYIENDGPHIGGEGFTVDGQLVFRCFSNEQFSTDHRNPFISIMASWPYLRDERIHQKIHDEIQRLLTLLEMKTSALNFDIRIDKDENVYIIEIAPRNGGGCNSKIVQYATGIDLIEYTIRASLGEDCSDLEMQEVKGYWADYVLVNQEHSGQFNGLDISEEFLKKHVVEYELFVNPGDYLSPPTTSYELLGNMILKFHTSDEMLEKLGTIHHDIKIKINDSM